MEHQIEPELHQSLPRRVHRRGQGNRGLLIVRFLIFAVLLMTAFLTGDVVHGALVRLRGIPTNCQITDRSIDRDSDGNSLFYLTYLLKIEGQEITQRERVEKASYEAIHIGQQAQANISPWFPERNSFLLLPGRTGEGDVWWASLIFLTLLVMSALTYWFCWLLPARARLLARYGIAVTGRITDKRIVASEEVRACMLHYEFWPEPVTSPFGAAEEKKAVQAKQNVPEEEWNKIQAGDTRTVLYDPKKPENSTLYRYGEYEAVK